jgi:putative flippase GtrA
MKRRGPAWAVDFFRFGIVGAAGFVVNTAAVYAVRGLIGVYAAGVIAWALAATTTWWLNRSWTFAGRGAGAMHHQWLRFLSVSLVGFILYYTAFSLLVSHFRICAAQPVIAILGGVLVGMVSNFTLSRQLVFR